MAHEVDFGVHLGALTRRLGYDSIGQIAGQDSIISIYPVYLSDGREYLVITTDSAGVGYGNVYVTNYGSVNLSVDSLTRIMTYWGTQYKPSFTTLQDDLYGVNGSHKGFIWNGKIKRSFPLSAPGEVEIYPLDDTGSSSVWTLDGEYRYGMVALTPDSAGGMPVRRTMGYISQPIRVKTGRVLIAGFAPLNADTLNDTASAGTLYIYRTDANPGYLDYSDSLWIVDTVDWGPGTNFDTVYFIDSLPDDSITDAKGRNAFYWDGDTVYSGRDSSGAIRNYYGAPRYMSAELLEYDTAYADTAKFGIFYGVPTQKDTLGVAYMCTFIDTVTGIESDSSRSCVIFNYKDDSLLNNIQLSLPKAPRGDSGLVRNLYRALIYQITYDTGHFKGVDEALEEFKSGLGVIGPMSFFDFLRTRRKWIERLVVDTVVIYDYYLLAQVSACDTTYTDSIRYDSLRVKRRYIRSTAPSLLSNIVSHDDKIFGGHGSRQYFSKLDSGFAWGAFDFVSLNMDDGDEINIIFPTQGGMLSAKNKSVYSVFQDANGYWYNKEITGLPGCIAPKSYAKGFAGHYYLSDYGVVRIADGQYLDRRYTTALVSAKLKNFDVLPLATKREAVGMYIPSSRQYLLTIGDTTYAYDERADGWSTWGLKIGTAGLYGVEDELVFVPGDTMYFVPPGDSVLFRYGSSATDTGTNVTMIWKSAPMFVDRDCETMTAVGIWGLDNSSDTTLVYRFNEKNTIVGPGFLNVAGVGNRYVEMSTTPQTYVCQGIYLSNWGGSTTGRIDGVDIFYTKQGTCVDRK